MSTTIAALRGERQALVAQMRALTETAADAKRDLTGEETARHETLYRAQDRLRQIIEGAERERDLGPIDSAEMRAFSRWLKGGRLRDEELRALNAGTVTEGGGLVPPGEFVAAILGDVDDIVSIRGRATVRQVSAAQSLGQPTIETHPSDADWTTELQAGSKDTAMRFGKRQLVPHPIAKRVEASKALLRSRGIDVAGVVREALAYKVGVTLEKAYLTGDGAAKPLGLFTASDHGIPAARDVSTGNATTAMTFDGLIEAKFSVKSQYWPNAAWIFHRDAVLQITKLKDGNGAYVWRPSERDGEPDRLLGHPLFASEYAPNTFTTGQYVGVFGDLKFYHIVDALNFTVQRLVELYAESHLDGFFARYEGDGMPALAEAFARVKLA